MHSVSDSVKQSFNFLDKIQESADFMPPMTLDQFNFAKNYLSEHTISSDRVDILTRIKSKIKERAKQART